MTLRHHLRRAANLLWLRTCRADHDAFLHALSCVEETQRRHLFNLLDTNAGTQFGSHHRFADIHSVRQYQATVPLTRYEDYSAAIEDISAGRQRVLSAEPVMLFQPSSGTSSASKLIPYTAALRREFQRGIAPWIVTLYRQYPRLLESTVYWVTLTTIVPDTVSRETPGWFCQRC